MNETEKLVQFLVEMDYDSLPPEVKLTAKLCLLDTLGVGIFGAKTEWAGIVADMVKEAGSKGESTVWSHNLRTSAQYAALVNGTAAHGIEMDDRKPALRLHAGAMTIAAAMAAAERAGADGKTLLTAIVAGYEAAFRVARSVPGLLERGFHAPAHLGTWGAAAAATKALGLTQQQMLDAFGIAGSMASGIWEFSNDNERNMVKRFHGGWPAHNGVMVALLGQRGLTAPRTVLEGKFGYCQVFAGPEGSRLDELTKNLGQSYQILLREVKPYAAWGGSHVCIEAMMKFKAQYPVQAGEIEKVSLGCSSFLIGQHEIREPKSIMAAQYSLPFIVAAAFFKDLSDPSAWQDKLLSDKAVLDLAKKVEWYVDDEMEAIYKATHVYGGVRALVKLRDGREFRTVVYNAKGTEENPMTPQEIHDKFRVLARHVLRRDQVEEVASAIDSLEKMDNVRQLGEMVLSRRAG